MASLDGQIIATRYIIEEEIGRGGMAVVYRAFDNRLNRPVALKLLHPYLANQSESAARFTREAEAIAKLHHPNIVEIYDTGQDDNTGSQFLVMELIEGHTLLSFINEHPTKIPEIAIAMTCCMCDALDHAHRANIIHRDIKPENIMIAQTGIMKLTDFGIARVIDAERMTASGNLIGSPAHMPPEIINGQKYGFSCDIFSLGTVIYFALTNTLPFKGTNPMSVFKAILDGNFQMPSRRNLTISKSIDKVVAKCLNTDPADRFPDAMELKAALLEILKPIHFDDYNAILSEYFANPEAFNEKYIPIITGYLDKAALDAVKNHQTPKALECLNCVLAYNPDNAEAIALLKKLRNGRSLRQFITRAAIILGILAIIAAISHYFIHRSPRPGGSTQPSSQLPSPEAPPAPVTETPADPQNSMLDPRYPANRIDNIQPFSQELAYYYRQFMNWTQPAERPFAPEIQPGANKDIVENTDSPKDTATRPGTREAVQIRTNHVRTPKKARTAGGEKAELTPPPKPEIPAAAPPDTAPLPESPALVQVTQPVFPPDAFAIINGKKFTANSSGDILLSLPPGTHKVTLTCAQRCVKQSFSLTIAQDSPPVTRDVISLDWADATLSLYEPEGKKVYFVARRLDDRTNRMLHLVARTPNAIAGFNTFGKPIILEVYAIPQNHTLNSYDADALESAKLASTRVSINPGESRTVRF